MKGQVIMQCPCLGGPLHQATVYDSRCHLQASWAIYPLGTIFLQTFLHLTARKISGSNPKSVPHQLSSVSSSVEWGHLDRYILSSAIPTPSSARAEGASCHSGSPCQGARHPYSRAQAAGPSEVNTGREPRVLKCQALSSPCGSTSSQLGKGA